MYYLWKDKISTPGNLVVYITDYKEIRKEDGFAKIDPRGYIDVELIFSHKEKPKIIEYAQNLMNLPDV